MVTSLHSARCAYGVAFVDSFSDARL